MELGRLSFLHLVQSGKRKALGQRMPGPGCAAPVPHCCCFRFQPPNECGGDSSWNDSHMSPRTRGENTPSSGAFPRSEAFATEETGRRGAPSLSLRVPSLGFWAPGAVEGHFPPPASRVSASPGHAVSGVLKGSLISDPWECQPIDIVLPPLSQALRCDNVCAFNSDLD